MSRLGMKTGMCQPAGAMVGRGFCVKVELDLHAVRIIAFRYEWIININKKTVQSCNTPNTLSILLQITCPGVWLCPSGKIGLQIDIFNLNQTTHRVSPIFPLLYHDKFMFKKVFSDVSSLSDLQRSLEDECVFAELIQYNTSSTLSIVLATFETSLVDLLYPTPSFKGLVAGTDINLLMEPTVHFPVSIDETREDR